MTVMYSIGGKFLTGGLRACSKGGVITCNASPGYLDRLSGWAQPPDGVSVVACLPHDCRPNLVSHECGKGSVRYEGGVRDSPSDSAGAHGSTVPLLVPGESLAEGHRGVAPVEPLPEMMTRASRPKPGSALQAEQCTHVPKSLQAPELSTSWSRHQKQDSSPLQASTVGAPEDSPQRQFETSLRSLCCGPWETASSSQLPGGVVDSALGMAGHGELQTRKGNEAWKGGDKGRAGGQFGAIANAVQASMCSTCTEYPFMTAGLVLDASVEGPGNSAISTGRAGVGGGHVAIKSRSWMEGVLARMASGRQAKTNGR